jgi:hypothetical protein
LAGCDDWRDLRTDVVVSRLDKPYWPDRPYPGGILYYYIGLQNNLSSATCSGRAEGPGGWEVRESNTYVAGYPYTGIQSVGPFWVGIPDTSEPGSGTVFVSCWLSPGGSALGTVTAGFTVGAKPTPTPKPTPAPTITPEPPAPSET